jgi:hypothetical protein
VLQLSKQTLDLHIIINENNLKTLKLTKMENLTNEQIISVFIKSFIPISKVETKGRENGMICTISRGTPKFFSTYYSAYCFFNERNMLKNK